jgi:hypothetical protein
MTDHPITPPPELIRKWNEEAATAPMADQRYIAIQAAHWGADQELEACCEWLTETGLAGNGDLELLRDDRRPTPPSLKEQGLDALASLQRLTTDPNIIEPIRRALEQLPE